ncbi:MAG TPA: esterase-like activity of phytase family protein [Terriglobales bacterium]
MRKALLAASVFTVFTIAFVPLNAQIKLLAVGQLTSSSAGPNADLSGLTNILENGAPANLLGGFGSGITWASGNTFLAVPDRGPNAIPWASSLDDTASYIERFHTITMDLEPNSGAGLPFTLTPTLQSTTLFYSPSPLVYGAGGEVDNLGNTICSGVPLQNRPSRNYFTGRSDNFDPNQNSGYSKDARLDSEGVRVSNDGQFVYTSDEYGPYVNEFLRSSGQRVRSFRLPDSFYVSNLSPMGAVEISGNTSGRVANKGMEGLAITPDGKTLVGMVQNALIQDANEGGAAVNLLRIVTIDRTNGKVTHQYAYLLTTGSGVSEIVALNNHEFLVDERDGKGRASQNNASVKQLFKIDLAGAVDVSGMDGLAAAGNAVPKTLFLDIVSVLKANNISAGLIPAKLEGVSFGPDVNWNGSAVHTLWVANDNDFLLQTTDSKGNTIDNPNQFFVFGFGDADLSGSKLVLQQFN